MSLELRSSQFDPGGEIPIRFTCQGEDISPPLQWRGVPSDTKSLVLICDDADAPGGSFCHWVVYNLPPPPDMGRLPEAVPPGGEIPQGGMQGRNDFGEVQYNGPCPPEGPEHQYYFRLYALDDAIDLLQGANRQQVLNAIEDHIIESTEMIGRYSASMTKTLL